MEHCCQTTAQRILIIDDNQAIHEDFRFILESRKPEGNLEEDHAILFDENPWGNHDTNFRVDCADQGQAGLALVQTALQEEHPYAVAFVDMRMPPGWDGVETIEHIWEVDPEIEIVICTAYSDHSWNDVLKKLGERHRLVILRKPFDNIEVWQLANSLSRKWEFAQQNRRYCHTLESQIEQRTQELRKTNRLLEEDVHRRMEIEGELNRAIRELAKARDQAVEGTRMKSEFLATMSHEIRTPMNGILGMTTLLGDTALTSEQQEYVNIVRSSSEILLTIINDILDFSKVEAGKMDLEIISFDLRNATEEVLDLLGGKADEKGLELFVLVEGTVPILVEGDPGRFRQILMNFVGNAIKFTEHGEVAVGIKLEEETSDEIMVRVDVTDTGIGMTPEGLARLFQSFSQVDSSTKRKFGGTGLGLVIAKQLVELMGGTIGVASEFGIGSRFWFIVRLRKHATPIISSHPVMNLEGLRVCIVDENATNRQMLTHYANTWGMVCFNAVDGPCALGLLREAVARGEACDLAILDMQMPTMDGFQLARLIKDDPALPPIPLVLLTSQGQRGDAVAAREAGFAAYLNKPIRYHEMHQCLITVLGGASSHESQLITQHTLREDRNRQGVRILVADDNIVNQKVLVRMVEKLGYKADVVADGQEVLDALEHVPYDLVLMDWMMPVMNGLEATQEIRRREALKEDSEELGVRSKEQEGSCLNTPDSSLLTPYRIPIIGVTANAMKGDREQCLQAGMDAYVSKPVKIEELSAALQQWIPEKSEWRREDC